MLAKGDRRQSSTSKYCLLDFMTPSSGAFAVRFSRIFGAIFSSPNFFVVTLYSLCTRLTEIEVFVPVKMQNTKEMMNDFNGTTI
jgi:hypothetical protein